MQNPFTPATLVRNRQHRLATEAAPVLRYTTESTRFSVPEARTEAPPKESTMTNTPTTTAPAPIRKDDRDVTARNIRRPQIQKRAFSRLTDGIKHPVTVRQIAATVDLEERFEG